ncbi:unnamed protein product [Sphagnum balticum]|jgi:hypothetical protein
MADADPPWARVAGRNYDPVGGAANWATSAGRELTATRVLLEEGRNSDSRRVIVDAANAILIGASLIASITYASWLLLPYDNIVHKKAVKVFWAFNSLSFFFAIATVLVCASAVTPNYRGTYNRYSFTILRFAAWLFSFSVFFVLGAFTSAAYVRVPYKQGTYFIHDGLIIAITVGGTIVSLIGLFYFVFAFFFRFFCA